MQDKKALSPSFILTEKDEGNLLDGFLTNLDYRQRYIIVHRFGLDGSKPKTLESIGKEFNLTRERIRQLELSALLNLREMYKKADRHKYIE